MEANNDKTLNNNKVSQFILRIDLNSQMTIDLKSLAESLLPSYESMASESIVEYNVSIPKDILSKLNFTQYVLKTDNGRVRLKINEREKAIIIDANHYVNNSVYKDRVSEIIKRLKELGIKDITARRIGLRYINTFPCTKRSEIGKIIKKPLMTSIINSLDSESLNRSMQVNEYIDDAYATRVQYGLPNKFFPSKIINYDVVLDIDVYFGGLQSIDDWEESIREYNHAAHRTFLEFIEPSFVEKLK